jgi:hypothetical protein
LFRSENVFRTTQELEYLFFCRAKREILFQNLSLGYMTKILNQIIFFSFTKTRIFFQQHWESDFFFRKKNHNPPPPPWKLNGPSLRRYSFYRKRQDHPGGQIR